MRNVKEDSCVIVDVETTGLSPHRGERIIEIGAVVIAGGRIVDEFYSLIDPGRRVTIQARSVHHITNDMLAGKPKPERVLPQLRELVGDSELVAHNAVFDMSFLRHEFGRLGLSFNNPYRCTLAMSRRRFPHLINHKLETVYRHMFGDVPEGTKLHRALNDARMVARMWLAFMK